MKRQVNDMERLVYDGIDIGTLTPNKIIDIVFKLMRYEDLEENLNGISLQQLTDAFIASTEKETNEIYGKARILTNQDLEDYDNRYWEREAKKWCNQLGSLRKWLDDNDLDMDDILRKVTK
jgi:hypothetical protein